MHIQRAAIGAHTIAFVDEGDGAPLLCVMGIGAQLIMWPSSLVAALVAGGARVIRYDHRDVGESSPGHGRAPTFAKALAMAALGRRFAVPYGLADLANDAIGLLDHLRIERAHVVGISMGGMVAQHMALAHPHRLASMSLLMTTPGGRRYLPKPAALRALLRPRATTEQAAGDALVDIMRVIGTPAAARRGDGVDDDAADRAYVDEMRAVGRWAFRRGGSPAGFYRHFAAVLADGSRRARLPAITVPTAVIHGTADPLIPLAAGRALADGIPGAWWLPLAGMGHDLSPRFVPTLAALILARMGPLAR